MNEPDLLNIAYDVAYQNGAAAERERMKGLVEALSEWFAAKCPVDWTEDEHLRNPTVNTANSREARLATAYVERLGGPR